jgi:hypothetical protein
VAIAMGNQQQGIYLSLTETAGDATLTIDHEIDIKEHE